MRACFRVKRHPPIELGPGEELKVPCVLRVSGSGKFSAQLHVYVADPDVREIVLTAIGDVVSSASSDNRGDLIP
jgi:hypothetical protein